MTQFPVTVLSLTVALLAPNATLPPLALIETPRQPYPGSVVRTRSLPGIPGPLVAKLYREASGLTVTLNVFLDNIEQLSFPEISLVREVDIRQAPLAFPIGASL